MPAYLSLNVKAVIKIQDPYDEKTIEEIKENIYLSSPVEILEEDYSFDLIDAD